MQERKLQVEIIEYSKTEDLPSGVQKLMDLANNNLDHAYAPYSQFQVSAAIELVTGEIVIGTNQENVAYPSGTCAERTALYYTSSSHPGVEIKRIFITAFTTLFKQTKPITPCGSCRQVISEYENKQKSPIEVWMTSRDSDSIYFVKSSLELLPLSFYLEQLKKG